MIPSLRLYAVHVGMRTVTSVQHVWLVAAVEGLVLLVLLF